MLGLQIESTNPAYNLALEEYLFTNLQSKHPGWFLLWQNEPSIIVGKHQNTLEEINIDLVNEKKLHVIRRLSGGGAVYHDLGNLNYSFLLPEDHDFDSLFPAYAHTDTTGQASGNFFQKFLNPIVHVLRSFGLAVELSGRNDLTLDGKKVSGSAQLRKKNMVLHHGTLLVSLDLDMLGRVLMGPKDKFTSKGIDSIKSRVTNLCDYAPKEFSLQALKQALMATCATEQVVLSEEDALGAKALAEKKYSTWDWNYGSSPKFTHKKRNRFSWGALEICFMVNHGHITQCQMYGDFFSNDDVSQLEASLIGKAYNANGLRAHLQSMPLQEYFLCSKSEDLIDFICEGV